MATADPASLALSELTQARRRRRVAQVDSFEALYRAYLTVLLSGLGVLLLSNLAGDEHVSAAGVAQVRAHGPAVIGLLVAFVVAIGLRSGGRGGPLALHKADVRHVLLAPVDRSVALRRPAVRQARFAALSGLAAGAMAGLNAAHRLPGPVAGWMAAGAAAGVATVAGGMGAALLVSGHRVPRVVAGLGALAVLGWAGFDLATERTTSPFTLVGSLALWPLRVHSIDVAGALLLLALPIVGVLRVGGTSLEASELRARLVGALRFAATLHDVRTVMVLRRQLAQERPRSRPWIRLRGWKLATVTPRADTGGLPVATLSRAPVKGLPKLGPLVRRSFQGISRWPWQRLLRLAFLAAAGGLAAAGVWQGTTSLVVVVGLCAYLAALDAIEPLSQDADHPDRLAAVPRPAGQIRVVLLIGPVLAMVVLGFVGIAAAIVAGAPAGLALQAGAPLTLPVAVLACGGAAISTMVGASSLGTGGGSILLPPETAGIALIVRAAAPPALAIIGVLPLLAGRSADALNHPVAPAVLRAMTFPLFTLGILVFAYIRFREELGRFMEDAKHAQTRRPPPRRPAGGDPEPAEAGD